MPFEVNSILKDSTSIYLMRYDDFEPENHMDRLTQTELERFFTFKSPIRRREFVATRILRHKIFGFEHIHYDTNGAPFIESEGFISISHSKNLIGIATNREYKIALDLESFRDNIGEISYRFLSEKEKRIFDCTDTAVLTRIWSAKEVLYKLAGRKLIHFKRELIVDTCDNNYWIGRIDNFDHVLKVKLDIFEHEASIVSFNKAEIEREKHYDITAY